MSLALRVLKSWLSNVLPVRDLPDGGSSGVQFLHRRRCNGIKIGLTMGMILGTSGSLPSAAFAQQAQPVSILVAPMTHVAPSSQTQLPIKINSKDALPRDTFIRIRGLPALVALSEGYATARVHGLFP